MADHGVNLALGQHKPSHSPPGVASSPLNGWKEISSYLNRGVRTAQRWEGICALPVHRPAGKRRSAVIAISSELDDWLRQTPRPTGGTADSKNNHSELRPPQYTTLRPVRTRGQSKPALLQAPKEVSSREASPTFPDRRDRSALDSDLLAMLRSEVTGIFLGMQQIFETHAVLSPAVAAKLRSIYDSASKMRAHLDAACTTPLRHTS